jgi:hypothetical protein
VADLLKGKDTQRARRIVELNGRFAGALFDCGVEEVSQMHAGADYCGIRITLPATSRAPSGEALLCCAFCHACCRPEAWRTITFPPAGCQ